MNKDEQQRYFELQLLSQQTNQIKQQIDRLDQQILELKALKQSINEISKLKQGTEILVPLGSGIFTKADIKEPTNLLMNVGANTIIHKNNQDSEKIIDIQIKEIQGIMTQMELEFQKCVIQAEAIQEELSKEKQ